MKLIAGLGNPGIRYKLTRHNIGFIILDQLSEFLKTELKPAKDEWFGTEFEFEGTDVYLMKPMTYMNNSGLAVLSFIIRNDIKIDDILIVHDDFNLQLGTIRVRKRGTDGGHNGISSIIYHLNTLEFPRMRVGIGSELPFNREEYIDFVLTKFTEDEFEKIYKMIPNYRDCIINFLKNGIIDTMNKFNKNFLDKENNSAEDNLQI